MAELYRKYGESIELYNARITKRGQGIFIVVCASALWIHYGFAGAAAAGL